MYRQEEPRLCGADVMSALMKLCIHLQAGCCLSTRAVPPVRSALSLQMAHDTAVLSRQSFSSQAARFGRTFPWLF